MNNCQAVSVMCGRFTLHTAPAEIARYFSLAALPPLQPRYNIAPGQQVACLRTSSNESKTELTWLKWGLVPSWMREPPSTPMLINARCETVAIKPAFRTAFRQRRCIVLADGFYEWQKLQQRKQPWYITRSDRTPFAMAAVWEPPSRESGVGTVAIITTTANSRMSPLHDRMPVMLNPCEASSWLDPRARLGDLQARLAPCPEEEIFAREVSDLVNNWRNERPECIELIQRRLFE